MTHNYVAEPGQYPSHIKVCGYGSKEEYLKRFKKSAKERAELFALKMAYAKNMRKEYGNQWETSLRKMTKPFRQYSHTISSGAKIIAQWN